MLPEQLLLLMPHHRSRSHSLLVNHSDGEQCFLTVLRSNVAQLVSRKENEAEADQSSSESLASQSFRSFHGLFENVLKVVARNFHRELFIYISCSLNLNNMTQHGTQQA